MMSKSRVEMAATCVAARGAILDAGALAGAAGEARIDWLEPGVAADAIVTLAPSEMREFEARMRAALPRADVILQPIATRRKALLVADMDSTMIAQECVDELADALGLKARIAPITERAMRGELDFAAALRERVALLRGLSLATLRAVLANRVTLTPGAAVLVATMRAKGAHTALLSGGFTHFAEPVAEALGCNEARANRLEIAAGALTGRIAEPILGAADKAAALEEMRRARGLPREETLAIGDGANDLPMLSAAGLGVAYRAKPIVAAQAGARLEHADLAALLYAQGYKRSEFVTPPAAALRLPE